MTHPQSRPPRLRLGDYYLLEGVNSASSTLFFLAIFFWAHARLGFGADDNLLLGSVQGLVYIFASIIGGRLAERFGYDRIFCASLLLAVLALPLLLLMPTAAMTFVVMGLYTVAISGTWPALEASIVKVAARYSAAQRVAIYNVVWSLAGTAGLFVSGALFLWNRNSVIFLPLFGHALQLVFIALRKRSAEITVPADLPATPTRSGHSGPVGNAPRFVHVAWLGNMLSYMVVSGVSALAPSIGERLGLPPHLCIWLVCSMFCARGLSFILFGMWEGWHYRWSMLIGSILLVPVGLSFVFFSQAIPVVIVVFVILGVLLGLIYSSSLYYSLDIGENKGENGGFHEAVLGIGLFLGPLVGVFGARYLPALAGHPEWSGAPGAKFAIIALYVLLAGAGLLGLSCRRRTPCVV